MFLLVKWHPGAQMYQRFWEQGILALELIQVEERNNI